MQSMKEGSVYEILCEMLDGNLPSSLPMSDSKIWFALEHPKVSLFALLRTGIVYSERTQTHS